MKENFRPKWDKPGQIGEGEIDGKRCFDSFHDVDREKKHVSRNCLFFAKDPRTYIIAAVQQFITCKVIATGLTESKDREDQTEVPELEGEFMGTLLSPGKSMASYRIP